MIINIKCPKCGSKNTIPIIYGNPSYDLFLEEQKGKVKLGCCCITDDDPEYYCKDCEHEWRREENLESRGDNERE